jgi:DtxR family Mn-dependent transcriptional regulator
MERADLVVIDASRQVTPTTYALETAEALIRRHMLVELFLSGILNLPIDDVQRESLRMDHVFTPAMEMRVNSVLGHPTACPHAIAIPQSSSDRGAAASGTASPWFIDELAAPAATQHWYRHGLLPRERVTSQASRQE